MRSEMQKYGLPEPEFSEERGAFKVVFRNTNNSHLSGQNRTTQVTTQVTKIFKDEKIRLILEFCEQPRSTNEILALPWYVISKTYTRYLYKTIAC